MTQAPMQMAAYQPGRHGRERDRHHPYLVRGGAVGASAVYSRSVITLLSAFTATISARAGPAT